MKRSNAALAVLVAGALTCGLGCGDGGSKTGASAEPAKSGAAASSAGAKTSAAAKSTGAPATTGDKPKDAPAATAGVDVLKHMPKECDEGRIYVNVGKLFAGGDLGTSLDTIVGKAMAQGKADDKKAEAVMKTLKEGGVDPLKDIREVAVCANKDDKKTVVVVSMEPKADKPADVFAKAAEAATGKAPTKEDKDGATWVQSAADKSVMAFVGKNVMLVGEDKDVLAAAIKGGDGASEFGDAKSSIVWAKVDPNKSKADINMKETGSDYDLKVMFVGGKDAPKMKEQFEKMLPEVDKAAEQMPFVKPLLPVAKNGKIEVAGENVTFTTKFPKAAIADFLKEASKVDPKEIMKGLKF
ncbi:MAG: hypothetical protein JNL21_11380 [Myxococcales bacterium]|nr:hypothetical protein [Myxococcales bacterium]